MRLLGGTLLLVGMSWAIAADPPAAVPPPVDIDSVRNKTAYDQEHLRQQYNAFQQALLSLAQRLEKSAKPEDRDKAASLRQAIELANRESVDTRFSKLVTTLAGQGATMVEIEAAIKQNEELAKTLREMLALLLSDNQSAKAKEEEKRLQNLLKALDKVIRAQKIERSKVESGKGEPEDLAKGQNKVTKETEDLAKAMGKSSDKDDKGEPKTGEPKGGEPKDGQPKSGQPKDGEPKDGEPKPNQDQPKSEDESTRKQVRDATDNQRKAEDKIKKDDRPGASNEQDEAIKKLEEARKEIERKLKQLREEEMERLLANLENRCQRMLALQIEVYDGTKRVFTSIEGQPDKKASRADDLKSGELSAKEGQIIVEATKTLQLLAEEGSAVAFPLVLEDLREQMKVVQARLFKTDVGTFTQSIEEDIISSLKEMIAALKKAQQDMKDKKDQPPPQGGQPPPQKLIDTLADLKMIRALQTQINNRTKAYAASYPGEQADDADIRKELHGLAERENKVQKVTKDIATGKTHGQ
jgi:hypothetical protein